MRIALKLEGLTKHEAVASIISDAKSAMTCGKEVLALRSCGVLLMKKGKATAEEAKLVLDSMARLNVCVVRSVRVAVESIRGTS